MASEKRKRTSLYDRATFFVQKLEVIWHDRRFFIKWCVIGVAISIAIVVLIPTHYTATATLMPPNDASMSFLQMLMGEDPTQGAAPGGSGASSALGSIGSLLGMGDEGQLYVHATQSRTVEDRIIQRFGLMSRYRDRLIEDCRKDLEHFTDVDEDKKSGTIDIAVTDKDPKIAADMANAYVEELNRLMLEVNMSAARQEREVTQQRVDEAQHELDVATKNLADFSSKNTMLEPDDQGKAAVEISAAMEGQLMVAQADLKELEKLYTPNNQRVYSARARVAELERQLAAANSEGLHGENTEGKLPSVRKIPLIGVQYLDLYRQAKVREEVLRVLTEELELARIRENHQVSTVSVMDVAVVPTKKSFPPRSLLVLGLSFVAFWVVVGCVMVREEWQAGEESRWRMLFLHVWEILHPHKERCVEEDESAEVVTSQV